MNGASSYTLPLRFNGASARGEESNECQMLY